MVGPRPPVGQAALVPDYNAAPLPQADPGVGGFAGADHAENGDGDALPGSCMAQLRDQIGDAQDEPRPRGGAGTEREQ